MAKQPSQPNVHDIARELLLARMPGSFGYLPEALAREAYQIADAFCREAALRPDGQPLPLPKAQEPEAELDHLEESDLDPDDLELSHSAAGAVA